MESIYEELLGDSFERLHPKLQQRYHLTNVSPFKGRGVMETVSGGAFFVRQLFRLGVKFRLLFSERGEHIPFTIENTVETDCDGKTIVCWNRTFMFEEKSRYFDAVMYYDQSEKEIYDRFGLPCVLISTLSFTVDEQGFLHITPKKQWLNVFGKRIPLPTFLYGQAHIFESYDDKQDCFCIQVEVHNPLLGTLFSYRGTFQEEA